MTQVITRGNRSGDDVQTVVYTDAVYKYTCVAPVGVPLSQPLKELAQSNGRQIFREERASGSIMMAMNHELIGTGFEKRGSYQCNADSLGAVAGYDYQYVV